MDRIEITVRREDENAQKKDKLKYNLFLVIALCFFAYAVFSLLIFFASIAARKVALTDLIPVIIPAAAGIIFLVLRENFPAEGERRRALSGRFRRGRKKPVTE